MGLTRTEAAELIDLIAERAPKLRDAGVRRLRLEDLELELAPPEVEVAGDADDDEDEQQREPRHPFYDPATFGRRRGVPGRKPGEENGR